jgi:hypothetical protein
MNPFMPDRGVAPEGIRHIPYPAQADTIIDSGSTPADFLAQPTAMLYGQTEQPIEWNQAAPPFLDATERLRSEGYVHQYLMDDPRVNEWPAGPGEKQSGLPGWM